MADVELKLGDRLKDNDPRMPYRGLLEIVALSETHVAASDGRFTFRVQRRRIHTDGKPRRTGFDLVKES